LLGSIGDDGHYAPCFFLGAMRPFVSVELSMDSPRHENFRGESCDERTELGFVCQKLSRRGRVYTCHKHQHVGNKFSNRREEMLSQTS
jgi:hypothetical protein